MLEEDQFLKIVGNAPLVSIDLIVRSPANELLMGMRINQPAKGYWFVPGGRIRKGETLDAAFSRITKAELGQEFNIGDAQLIGAFTHIYETNFANAPNVETHYVVNAYELQIAVDLKALPSEQHSAYRWVHQTDEDQEVHENSRAYFAYLSKMTDAQYSVLNARRDAFNELLWETPVLSLLAQSFLFTIILDSASSMTAVLISSILAIVTAGASRHLLDKHRFGEVEYARWLQADERIKGVYEANRKIYAGENWTNFSAYQVWKWVLPLFGVMALVALITRAIGL